MNDLNARFHEAGPSDGVGGVLMRNFEGMAGRHSYAWEPCADDEFCARSADRLAASIVNRRMPHLFSSDSGGMVVATRFATILCSYHGDGNNYGRFCKPPTAWLKMPVEHEPDGSCVPGCTSHFGWCDDKYEPCPLCEEVKCAWRRAGLSKMLEAHASKLSQWKASGQTCDKGGHQGRSKCHNELVLDAVAWTSHMPGTVSAMFYQRTSRPESVAEVRKVHAAFLRMFGLSARTTPLVVYDVANAYGPFSQETLDG